MKYTKLIPTIAITLSSLLISACSTATEITIAGYPESIVEEDDIFYVTVIGKTCEPTKKDGDGFITKLNARGKILAENAFPNVKLNAPKGAIIEDDILYVTDIDRVVGINLHTGTQVANYDLSKERMNFLNDIVEEDGKLYVSASDIDKIFVIDIKSGNYQALKTDRKLRAPNGLYIKDNTLFIAEYAVYKDENGKTERARGRIKSIPLLNTNNVLPVTVLHEMPGQYDGICVKEEKSFGGQKDLVIYFSDWDVNGKSGAIKKLNLRTKVLTHVLTEPANGPADFIIEDGKIWLPVMLDKKILIRNK